MQILVPLILLGLMYIMLIRPQQQRARRQRELLRSVEVGDRILTVGGLLGTVVGMDDETVDIEPADGIVLTFVRAAISRKVPDSEHDDQDADDTYEDEDEDEDGAGDENAENEGSPGTPEVEA